MAECSKVVPQVPKTIMVDGPPQYGLHMDIEEAQFLFDILRMVGGDPKKSRRRLADNIYLSLTPYRSDFARQHIDGCHTDINIQEGSIFCEEL
jgi:hypothetical protein